MHGLEWVFSIVLTVVYLIAGGNKAFRYQKARRMFPWAEDVPRILVQAIGAAEILGALGLVLPAATGINAWLTPVAAVALAVLMLAAVVFHALRREKSEILLPIFLLILLAFVVYLRWPLMP